jgi:hypothetical protein
MALDESGLSGDALKKAQAYNKSLKAGEENLKKQQKLWDSIGSTILGVGSEGFFRDLTQGELDAKTNQLKESLNKMKLEQKGSNEELDASFKKMLKNSNLVGMSAKDISKTLNINDDIAKKIAKSFNSQGNSTLEITKLLQQMGPEGEDFVKSLSLSNSFSEDMVQNFNETLEKTQSLNVEVGALEHQIENANESVLDLGKGFAQVGKNIGKNLIGSLLEFDKTIKQAQIDSGINFTENTTQMALLTSETARFGMSVEGTTKLMGDLGNELRTSNFSVLSQAAGDLAAMEKATGLSSQNISKLAGEYVNFGRGTKDMAKFSGEVMAEAESFGLNGREIMEDIANNMSKMRSMGFQGGEQSLKRMSIQAKRLGLNIDGIFDMSKQAQNIEGAMDMASQLQLAGGSFAAIDPMQLLSAARKSPEEMQKILAQMGGDLGKWVKDKDGNKSYEFDIVDTQRLQIVADATHQTVDDLQKMIAKNASENEKLNLLPPGLLGADLTEDEKAFLMNATSIGKNGALELNAGVEGIDSLENMTQKQLNAAMIASQDEKDSIEERAAQNMSFQESKDALMASITNLFSAFHPVLQMVTNLINGVNSLGDGAKLVVGGLALLFGPAKAIMQGINMAKGFQIGMKGGGLFSNIKDTFKSLNPFKGAGAAGVASAANPAELAKTAGDAGKSGAAGGAGGLGLKGLAEGLKAMGDAKVFRGIFAMALLGPAMIIFLPAIPGLLVMAGVGVLAVPIVGGFRAIATGFEVMGKALPQIIQGSLAMMLVGVALLPFVGTAYLMSQIDWLNVLFGVGVAALVVLGMMGLGALLVTAWPLLLIGGIGLAFAGATLLIGAASMALAGILLATAIKPLQEIALVDWSALIPFATTLSSFGLSTIIGAAGLLLGAIALALAAPLLAFAIAPLQSIAGTDWSTLKSFADGLSFIGPAMLTFAAAGLAMFNPLMLIGLVTMLAAITVLTSLMSTLGPNLEQGANGIERMAEGVVKLEEAVSALNMEKLSQLNSIAGSEGMVKLGEAMRGSGSNSSSPRGGGSNEPIRHIVELQLDGKKIKEIELRDTKHL